MEQPVEQPIPTRTEVIEEKPVTTKSRKCFWLLAGLGGGLLAFALVVLVIAVRFRPSALQPPLTAEDLAQQKYDAQQAENEVNKAAAFRNDPLLMRKEDADTRQQLNSMMNQLENNPDTPLFIYSRDAPKESSNSENPNEAWPQIGGGRQR
jgi:hypothetical protein